MNFTDFENKIDKINVAELMFEVIKEGGYQEVFEKMNREQLLEGRTHQNTPISPKYTEDNYFTSVQKAKNYARWKQKISPNPERNTNTPNLFITGKFHRSIQNKTDKFNFWMDSNDSNAPSIESKFKNIYGLTPDNIQIMRQEIMEKTMNKMIKLVKNG